MKTYTLRYLDTCLPGYFQGFGGHAYAVPLAGRPRFRDVLAGLLDQILGEELFIDGESAPEAAYEQLRASALDIFSQSDGRRSWAPACDDLSESYAYFGVLVESENEHHKETP